MDSINYRGCQNKVALSIACRPIQILSIVDHGYEILSQSECIYDKRYKSGEGLAENMDICETIFV
jgi:hypothetical protein